MQPCVGNATLEIGEAQGEYQPKPRHLHVYVPDTDATYQRALRAGRLRLSRRGTRRTGIEAASVKNAFENSWFIATYQGTK